MTVGSRAFDDLTVEANGRSDLYYDGGKRGLVIATEVALIEAERIGFGVGREYRNVLFAAVEYDLFIECSQALYLLHSAAAKACLECYAEVITHGYLIKASVEGYRLDVDVCVDHLDAFASYCACLVDDLLTHIAEMDSYVLQAILVTRGIENLIYADAAKLFFIVAAKTRKRAVSFNH
jgi:hypothetical protein